MLGGLLGRLDRERVSTAVKRVRRAPSRQRPDGPKSLERAVQGALGENPKTRALDIAVQAIDDGIVELTGTVPDRLAREIAASVARSAPGADVVVNRVLVEGEDVPVERGAPSQAG